MRIKFTALQQSVTAERQQTMATMKTAQERMAAIERENSSLQQALDKKQKAKATVTQAVAQTSSAATSTFPVPSYPSVTHFAPGKFPKLLILAHSTSNV
ncbi:hypothetical protein PUN28_018413 [Cardiocondyla obscurior]|uniref:Uncharacterized protein n=1 Tax=Cardiocondyla obscurior TaxID=286306 RepID=A0AAW2EHX1_9HYME